ncbi:MAG: hypothetical protein KTR23_08800 [Rhodospirillales bacterium]|nr:hypothetical protein [Rhodospirillales bacterium]
MSSLPSNLESLHKQEEQLREKALELIGADFDFKLHLDMIEAAMDLSESFRQDKDDNEELNILKTLSIRTFNSLGASLKLAFSGYNQNAALQMRDILETAFLLDYLLTEPDQILTWWNADGKTRRSKYTPSKIREALDKRDGLVNNKRRDTYQMFCELAGHPNPHMVHMLRPTPDSDIAAGPFMEITGLKATISEMAKLAFQVGASINSFVESKNKLINPSQTQFLMIATYWKKTYFS